MKKLQYTSTSEAGVYDEALYFGEELKFTSKKILEEGGDLRTGVDNDIEVFLDGNSLGMGLVEASPEAAAQTE